MQNYRFVDRVGVELEGGWDDPPFAIGSDGSVNVNANCVGEIASPPLLPREIEGWVRPHYPQALNDTCGMHVHISTRTPADYGLLMEKKFFDFWYERMEAWGKAMKIRKDHPFWARLEGKNTYCKKEFDPEGQVFQKSKGGNRYCQWNFCYGLHKTAECRMLPGFKMVDIAIKGIFQVVDTVELYLREHRPAFTSMSVVVTDEDVNNGVTLPVVAATQNEDYDDDDYGDDDYIEP